MASRTFASRSRPSSPGRPVRPALGQRPKRPSVIVAAAVAMTVLALALLLQETLPRREQLSEPLPLADAVMMLPTGAEPSQYPPLEVPDLPQSSYIVGFMMNDQAFAAFIRWSKDDGKYRLAATRRLADGDLSMNGQPRFSRQPLGTGAPVAILAQASMGEWTDGVMVLLPSGDDLGVAKKIAADGTAGYAVFPKGTSVDQNSDLVFNDVDADGDIDAVQSSTEADDTGHTVRNVQVFAWEDGTFTYDQALSWTLTASAKIFPEPTAPPAEIIEPPVE